MDNEKKIKNTGDDVAASRHLSTLNGEEKNVEWTSIREQDSGEGDVLPKVVTPTVHTLNRGPP